MRYIIITVVVLLLFLLLFVIALAALTNYNRLGGLNDTHLFLTVLRGLKKPKIKVPTDLVLGEGSLPGFQMATFLPCLLVAEAALVSLPFFSKEINPIMGALIS